MWSVPDRDHDSDHRLERRVSLHLTRDRDRSYVVLAWVLQHSDSVFRDSRICSRQLAGAYRGVRYAARRAVVRTFTRMALPAGRRDHFCLLALGVPQLAASFAGPRR